LLARLSNARPKIADYPFTTLEPHLGIVSAAEYSAFVMADLPGLIEGASQGRGLGHRFLKHIERTRIILLMIDSSQPDPEGTVKALEKELEQFNPNLLERPRFIAISKSDLTPSAEVTKFRFDYRFSAVTGQGLKELVNGLWAALQGLST